MRTPQLRHAVQGLAVAVFLLGAVAALGSHRAASSLAVARKDFAGLVDIGCACTWDARALAAPRSSSKPAIATPPGSGVDRGPRALSALSS
jgi:hypothetical protein